MLPDGSGAGRGGAGAEPAVEAPEAPTFSLDELNRCRGQLLGGGVFGDVYSLRGFPGLAVKELRLDGQPARLQEITKFELEALSQFSHPGVLKYHQVIEDGDFFYVVMDRYDRDLQRFITDHARTRRSIPRELMLSIVRQLAEALAYVHAPYKVNERGDVLRGIVHRDIKPANIMMSRDGERVIIADFGICKDAQHDGSTFAGTPLYMAPETLLNNKTSRASDIWALGVIIYELAALKRPDFTKTGKPEDVFVDGWEPDLSAIEDAFVKMVLEKIFVLDPEERPTARDLASLLQASDISGNRQQAQGTALEDRCMSLETALNRANARIASLEKDLKGKSTKIETLEKQYKNLSKIVEQHQKQLAKANEDLKQQITQEPKAIPNPSSPKAIKKNQACKGDAVQQYSSTLPQSSWTPLMRAAFNGDIEAAKRHLVDKNKRNSDDVTALMIAARAGHADIVELLDPTDRNGVTALMRAANRGDVEAVRALIPFQKRRTANCVKVNGRYISQGTALMMAAARGHAEVVGLLVEHEGAMQNNYGWTALMQAAQNGHTDCVKLLLEKEKGVQNNKGWTALMGAAWSGHLECVKLLLAREGGMQNNDGETAREIAQRCGHSSVADLLVEYE